MHSNEDLNKEAQSKKKGFLPKDVIKKHIEYFQVKYPKCFTTPPSPLSIDIHLELRIRENGNMSNNLINRLLAFYTKSGKYIKCLRVGKKRLDLDGNSTTIIQAEDLQQ
jgi:sRNA-binding protein